MAVNREGCGVICSFCSPFTFHLFEIIVVALLAAKMDDLTFDNPFYAFCFEEIGTTLRVAGEFGIRSRTVRLIPGTGRRGKPLPDGFYNKVG